MTGRSSFGPDSVARMTDGVVFRSGPDEWTVPSLRLSRGQWAALVPGGEGDPVVDPAGPLARILATLVPPSRGALDLFGSNIYETEYRDLQRLRARIGFVQGFGGLLSNRTLAENISLPLSVHGRRSYAEEEAILRRVLDDYALRKVADLKPSDVDGATRWRACVARALVLGPEWVVLEGIGDWEMDRGRGVAWSRLREYQAAGGAATAVCLSRQNPAFEAWFREEGGFVVRLEAQRSIPPSGRLGP